ncbi:amidohydrolase family protein [uncultured Mesotoga sp.]|uniref:amidohydrolase family protein n=1 Tax=uncultured Mesotoga sp. TaxID=1184400 RepID=UPI002592C3CC|nr:amidohydrolase family protein [uncultured Mesotoga sp.]
MQINNVSIYTNDGDYIPKGFVRVENGKIVKVAAGESAYNGENFYFEGKLLMPSLVNAHTHIYSTFARGLKVAPFNPSSFTKLLEQLWWRLDRAMTVEDLKISAYVAAIESLKSGVTSLFDHNSSPNAIEGSLRGIASSVNSVGLRYCGAYEVSDRDGTERRDKGIRENLDFSSESSAYRKGIFGLHASFTLSNETLSLASREIAGKIPIHVHVAEGPEDQEYTVSVHDSRVLERFHRAGLMTENSIYAHCIHTTPSERALVKDSRGYIVVNCQSNVNNGVGFPEWRNFANEGIRILLGNDGYGFNLCHDVRFLILCPHYIYRDPKVSSSGDIGRSLFGSNYDLATRTFGVNLGTIREGSSADFILLDYKSPTEITAENFVDHFFFGICENIAVSDAFVGGERVLAEGRPTRVNEDDIYKEARKLYKAFEKRF